MIGCVSSRGALGDLACLQTVGEPGGHEDVVEANVRRPRGECKTRIASVQLAITVDVAGVEDHLNRPPPDVPAAQPDECPQAMGQLAKVEQVAWRKCVEIAGEDVESVLVPGNGGKERAQLEDTPPFRPRGEDRGQVHTEHAQLSGAWIDLEERVAGEAGPVPGIVSNRPTTHEGERLAGPRGPFRHPGPGRETLDDDGIGGFLEHHEVGICVPDSGAERLFLAAAAAADVVAQDAQRGLRRRSVAILVDEGEIRLPQQLPAEVDHGVPGSLDVDGPPDHLHQPRAQRREGRRDVGVIVAQRT